MAVISAGLVRNEANRWLHEFLAQARFLSDEVVILDDCSDDDTVSICRQYAEEVIESDSSTFLAAEHRLRAQLWAAATRTAKRNDWILLFDADELLAEVEQDILRDLLHNRRLPHLDSLSFRLLDMWSETHYRHDQYWTAHLRQWVRAVRFDPTAQHRWPEKAQHCGSHPIGAEGVIGESGLSIRHMGWSRESDRRAKFRRYMSADPTGAHGWLAQYESILDPAPNLLEA